MPPVRLGVILLAITAACGGRETSSDDTAVPADTTRGAASAQAIALPIRAHGTEPFWALDLDTAGLRFTTPDDQRGIQFPPTAPRVSGDTTAWSGETERAAFDVKIWPQLCSDGMSDRGYPYRVRVRVDTTTYRGCADVRALGSPTLYPTGRWTIVDHRIPAVAAMTDAEATRWHGRTLSFSESNAMSPADTCRGAVYRNQNVSTFSLLRQFRATPGALGFEGRAQLGTTEVFCTTGRWTTAGGFLIWVDSTRVYTVWDGVFFGLRRSR